MGLRGTWPWTFELSAWSPGNCSIRFSSLASVVALDDSFTDVASNETVPLAVWGTSAAKQAVAYIRCIAVSLVTGKLLNVTAPGEAEWMQIIERFSSGS
jgi:hypothetical protein